MSTKKPADTKKDGIKDLSIKKDKGTALRDDELTKVVGGTVPKLKDDVTAGMHTGD